MVTIGSMASVEMSFENVDDDGRTTDAYLYYRLTMSSKTCLNQRYIFSTDRSKAVVPMLFDFYMVLW